MDIKDIIKNYVSKVKGYDNIEGQSEYLEMWQAWYKGFDRNFHKYYIKKDGINIEKVKKTMKGAKLVAQDWANLIANEKCDIVIDAKDQQKLEDILYENSFWLQLNNYYEKAMALSISGVSLEIKGIEVYEDGTLAKKTGTPKITFVKPEQVYPITIQDGTITEVAFASESTRKITIIIHLLEDDGTYSIHRIYCDKSTEKGISMPEFDDEERVQVFKTKSKYKWFATFSPNIANNLNEDSDLPISIFANSIDTLKALDNKYDGFDDEFWLGKRRIFVSTDMTKMVKVTHADGSETNEYVSTFDTNDAVVYTLPNDTVVNGGSNNNKIQTSAEPLRSNDYINGINQELSYLSKQCGLGMNRYQFESGGRPIQTATGVISQNSELYQNLRKHEIKLEQSLKEFTLAIIDACNNYTPIQFKTDYRFSNIEIKFDDSIIEDKESEQQRDRTNVQAGLLSEVEYRMKWMGETEEDAKAFVFNNLRYKIINNNLGALSGGAMSPKEFVDICYGDKNEQEKQEIMAYIEEQRQKSNVNPFEQMEEE